ncbi:MAG: hypothetical protein EPO11_00560 [Gammaproteobacteria bacterium]|nr:MAG: hypothetical protein EPO11_00560 [Gammaproteobacteria bacterium]
MTSLNLENLVKTKQLKLEPWNKQEFDGLVSSGRKRLTDANNHSLAIESRFDLAYNAAHSLALAALRWHGYRSTNRYLVFQALPFTFGLGSEVWRVLTKCHERRNVSEYEGYFEIDEQLLRDLLRAAQVLLTNLDTLPLHP